MRRGTVLRAFCCSAAQANGAVRPILTLPRPPCRGVFPIMTDPRATDLSAPMLSADETMPRPTHATHAHATERLDDVAPHRAFGPGRPGNLVVTPETATHGLEVLRREALGARQLGHRLLAQVESQDLLLSELKKTIAAIEFLPLSSCTSQPGRWSP